MSGSRSESYLARLAEAVSHLGDAIYNAHVRPDHIHELADRLDQAENGQVVVMRIRIDDVDGDGEGSDTRTPVTSLTTTTTRRTVPAAFNGLAFAVAA